ncbi:MAG: hypothetical protein RIT26_1537, partial [Pseudomonadota bacterium]
MILAVCHENRKKAILSKAFLL